ncbi:hypothetical protein C5614_18415 [Massilia phosphatilytica]|nr:hypothetical protein C5614_18415 [Massilia phosphatilytica]
MTAIRLVVCAALALAVSSAGAMTAVERRVTTATAPHLRLATAGKPVTVHYVHRGDDDRNNQMLRTMFDVLKHAVAVCVESKRRLGQPAHPPSEFPDQVLHGHSFEYAAPNRRITYNVGYLVNMADDCSLAEVETRTARLSSARGDCDIDLVHHTATGVCDATDHADAPRAPIPIQPTRAQHDATIAAMRADPRMAGQAAMIDQLARMPVGPGPRRTVAGHECELISAFNGGVEVCISREGSFVPSTGTDGIALMGSFATLKQKAVEVKFDMPVDASIFTPYRTGGYTITAGSGQ